MGELFAPLIPVMIFAIPLLAIWTKHQRKMAELLGSGSSNEAAQLAARNRELEDRVAVLERIITDKRTDLANEIESLREK